MINLNYPAIAAVTIAVFVISFVYYGLFARQLAALSPAYADASRPPLWKLLVELGRNLVVSSVVAGLVSLLGVVDAVGGAQLAIALWIGFPVVLWTGAVLWERVPARRAAIHAGDWLLKATVIAVTVATWR